MDILIVHDPREPAKKCSLTPLRGMPGVRFVSLRAGARIDAGRRIWLHPDADELSAADRGTGLLLVDCTWRRLSNLSARIDGELVRRRLPKLVTAYPRRSKLGLDPEHGLASVEALYAALAVLDGPHPELLAQYRWASEFLAANPGLPRGLPSETMQNAL
jgi:pre-rRNA-processing protein TSR3